MHQPTVTEYVEGLEQNRRLLHVLVPKTCPLVLHGVMGPLLTKLSQSVEHGQALPDMLLQQTTISLASH